MAPDADPITGNSGHPSAGAKGIEMLRDSGIYSRMARFIDAGSRAANEHRTGIAALRMRVRVFIMPLPEIVD